MPPKDFHPRGWSSVLRWGTLVAALASSGLTAADFWSAHVEPVLKEHCVECHSPTRSKGRLDLSTFQNALRGGEHGAGFVPGRPDESPLYLVLKPGADPHMPPKRQLSEEQIAVIRTGIERLQVRPTEASGDRSAATDARSAPAVPRRDPWVPPAGMAAPAVIDAFLERGWKARKVRPAAQADDATWLRRIHLDLVGRIPTSGEIAAFQRLPARHRREALVDGLLNHPDHARHLREVFDVLWMGRPTAKTEAQRRDHGWAEFLEASFRENRRWDALMRDLIVARPDRSGDLARRGLVQFLYERQNNPQAMAEAVAPLVFGVQIGCAQCHDHMVAREIKQAHYWGMVAAFNRSKNVDAEAGPGLAESAIGGFVSFANLKKESQQARLVFFNGRQVEEPWPADGVKEVDAPEKYRVAPPKGKERPAVPAEPNFSRRQALAEAVTRLKLKRPLERWLRSTAELPLADLLATHGVALTLRPAESDGDKGGRRSVKSPLALASRPVLGVRGSSAPGEYRVSHVLDEGTAQRAGLSAGDVIVAIDGLRVGPGGLEAALTGRRPGQTVQMHVFRRDELLVLDVELGAPHADTCMLALEDAGDSKRLRQRWLGKP